VKVCLALFVSSIAVSAYAQDAPNPVGEFLDAFRGKPVGPVAPPPASSAAVSGPQAPVSNTNQASTMAAQADATVTAHTLSCPPPLTPSSAPLLSARARCALSSNPSSKLKA